MIESITERLLSDWAAIYKTPDSRLYKRLVEFGWMEAPEAPPSREADELLFVWTGEG
jgi:hypothetical protein